MTDLEQYILESPLVDTHEHLHRDQTYTEGGPDILQELFDHYILHDLQVAGLTPEAQAQLLDATNPDIEARWAAGAAVIWPYCQYTGYGEAVRFVAREVYGIQQVTGEALAAANEKTRSLQQPEERLRILTSVGNLSQVQVDEFRWPTMPDEHEQGIVFYDLSWAFFANGMNKPETIMGLQRDSGVTLTDINSLRTALEWLFAAYGPTAIAVKSQHAYTRPLAWHERTDADANAVLQKRLRGEAITEDERLCLGDWCWEQGVRLAIQYNLPFKIHTGYYAGSGRMPLDYIPAGQMWRLLAKYPQARFVLMHIAYPYNDELVAIAKHYPNVWVDMCWAWSIDPYSAADFVRTMLHAVPVNKLFAFGGDTFWPNMSVAYAGQARRWLHYALQGEVDDGFLTEREAINIAIRLMQANQASCFDAEGTLAAIQQKG